MLASEKTHISFHKQRGKRGLLKLFVKASAVCGMLVNTVAVCASPVLLMADIKEGELDPSWICALVYEK